MYFISGSKIALANVYISYISEWITSTINGHNLIFQGYKD